MALSEFLSKILPGPTDIGKLTLEKALSVAAKKDAEADALRARGKHLASLADEYVVLASDLEKARGRFRSWQEQCATRTGKMAIAALVTEAAGSAAFGYFDLVETALGKLAAWHWVEANRKSFDAEVEARCTEGLERAVADFIKLHADDLAELGIVVR
jgi:hypothetical protein